MHRFVTLLALIAAAVGNTTTTMTTMEDSTEHPGGEANPSSEYDSAAAGGHGSDYHDDHNDGSHLAYGSHDEDGEARCNRLFCEPNNCLTQQDAIDRPDECEPCARCHLGPCYDACWPHSPPCISEEDGSRAECQQCALCQESRRPDHGGYGSHGGRHGSHGSHHGEHGSYHGDGHAPATLQGPSFVGQLQAQPGLDDSNVVRALEKAGDLWRLCEARHPPLGERQCEATPGCAWGSDSAGELSACEVSSESTERNFADEGVTPDQIAQLQVMFEKANECAAADNCQAAPGCHFGELPAFPELCGISVDFVREVLAGQHVQPRHHPDHAEEPALPHLPTLGAALTCQSAASGEYSESLTLDLAALMESPGALQQALADARAAGRKVCFCVNPGTAVAPS